MRVVLQASLFLGAVACVSLGVATPEKRPSSVPPAKTIDFNRDVRPILANNCFKCHGHDEGTAMAGLRLDIRDRATAKLSDDKFAIVPGKPEQSELIRRINASPDEQMPPIDTKKTLRAEEKQILEQWIREGAEYKEHWGFVAPVRQNPPKVKDKSWPLNPIDNFILAKIESTGLEPSPVASKSTLLRRVTFDLTGLPPTVKELDAFLADTSPQAYERVVDRLLASPRYGEHMTSDWMDIARYADSNGYQADYERYQWRWRDWVLDAYNQNMPYDEFIIEQVAGDMIPNATMSQRMATGFGRNHRINTEGGVIAEEWRVENVVDRVETTSQAFLGLTSGCARCHDHKFDPITQKDFYKLFAYFNSVSESGSGEERPINHPPTMRAPTPLQTERLANYDRRLRALDGEIAKAVDANLAGSQAVVLPEKVWPNELNQSMVRRFVLTDPPRATQPILAGQVGQPKLVGKPTFSYGRSTGSVRTNNDNYLDCGNVADFDNTDAFTVGGWAFSDNGRGAPFAKMDTANNYRGWDAMLINGVVLVHLINKYPDNTLKVVTKTNFPNNKWTHLMVTYDGSMKPEGLKVYINGKQSEVNVELNSLTATIKTQVPMTIGRRTGSELFNGEVDDVQIYNRALTPEEVAFIAEVDPAKPLLSIPLNKRTPEQKRELTRLVLLKQDKAFAKLSRQRDGVAADREKLDAQIPTLMVMDELPKPRETRVLIRGLYDKPGDKVEAGTPSFMPPLPTGTPNNRLGLAKWLASPENPLTARVAVNRMWERLFGTGIVETVEDFGTRAEFPSHPELLDWLATEFVRLDWDQKAMLKTMVMSATYRQTSAITDKHLEIDPKNRLLARGPRFRLNAEEIRDQALAVSGLLFNKLGGPSVYPPQPKGIWDETNFYGNLRNYRAANDASRYRRSMYTIWKRTAAPPNMLLFDAPTREACRVKRARTNTPLQALTLMNDETFLEASRVLAQNVLRSAGSSPAPAPSPFRERVGERSEPGRGSEAELAIHIAFRRVLLRDPRPSELDTLLKGYWKRLAKYKADPVAAQGVIDQGAAPLDKTLNPAELAAMTTVCTTLLNLDEAVTKE